MKFKLFNLYGYNLIEDYTMDTINNLIANDFEEYVERILDGLQYVDIPDITNIIKIRAPSKRRTSSYHFTSKPQLVEVLNTLITSYNTRIDRVYKNVKKLYNKMKIICIDDEDMIYASIIKYIEDCDEEQVKKYLKSPINENNISDIWKAYMCLYIENDVKNKLEKEEFVKNIFQQIKEDREDIVKIREILVRSRTENIKW